MKKAITKNTTILLPQDVIDFHELFVKNGFELYVVGGAVRDHLLGKTPHDFDLVTNATPDKVIEILSDYRADLQGAHFGVIRVFTKDELEGYEIASFRKDISSGRDNKIGDDKVEIGEHITIEDDVNRRDLTINALFYNIGKQEIVDMVGGFYDLKNNIIRTVGEAKQRFVEDRLRILRCLRFTATYNATIDNDTINAIFVDNRLFGISDIDDVSKERIVEEMKKVEEKSFNNPLVMARYLKLLDEFGILKQLFPTLVIRTDVVSTNNLAVAIALILRDNTSNDINDAMNKIKIPNKLQKIINFILLVGKQDINDKNFMSLYNSMNSDNGNNRKALIEWNNIMGVDNIFMKAFLQFERTVNGHDVLSDGFKGEKVGQEIKRRELINFMKLVDSI